ncbi:hypothetical protein [Dyella nitratireducens]|uniref:Uncharacterized protein n=1 Tax=Dyella nitratireducens TaxID=1849580 RepID=A0ABQ1GQL5_9GAMM|nr:hypothetical protein [Dyella nitratireducens]GGA48367.1 hypothetical protein GCM10010981_42000 [Dyella nitratireducens]GLQ42322.1 hypothetical protein GCM10007902_21720 [Dyella nitratireducens]
MHGAPAGSLKVIPLPGGSRSLDALYGRNPQTFVQNIFDAKPSDYVKATQRVWHTPDHASFISLPVVSEK